MFQKTKSLYVESFSGLKREVWYLSLVLFINRAGAMVIPFLTVYLTSERGFSLSDAGWIMSSFGMGSVVGSYVGGWITDRFGFYKVQQWTLVGSGLLFWMVGYLSSFWELFLGIFVLSTVTDMFRPANQTALAYYSNPANRARAYGLLRLAVNLGFSAGPVFGGLLIASLGYQWLFIVNGISVLMAAVAFRLLLPPGRQTKSEETYEEAPHAISAYRHTDFLLFTFFLMLGGVAFMQFFSSWPVFLKEELGYAESSYGMLVSINGLMIVAMEMPLVHKAGQWFRSLSIISFGYLLLFVSYLFMQGAAWSIWINVAFIVVITFGEMLSMPFASTYTANIAPPSRRGQYMGLLSISWAVSFIIAPVLGLHWAEAYGFESLWWLTCGLAIAGAVGIGWLNKKQMTQEKINEPSISQIATAD
ncbi:MAG: MFS transporter [Saprospiraceae bacterium]